MDSYYDNIGRWGKPLPVCLPFCFWLPDENCSLHALYALSPNPWAKMNPHSFKVSRWGTLLRVMERNQYTAKVIIWLRVSSMPNPTQKFEVRGTVLWVVESNYLASLCPKKWSENSIYVLSWSLYVQQIIPVGHLPVSLPARLTNLLFLSSTFFAVFFLLGSFSRGNSVPFHSPLSLPPLLPLLCWH